MFARVESDLVAGPSTSTLLTLLYTINSREPAGGRAFSFYRRRLIPASVSSSSRCCRVRESRAVWFPGRYHCRTSLESTVLTVRGRPAGGRRALSTSVPRGSIFARQQLLQTIGEGTNDTKSKAGALTTGEGIRIRSRKTLPI